MAQLTCQNLCAGYDGRPVLQDLSFELLAGDYLCIVGENGSGKSTLMKTILGLQAPISWRGAAIGSCPAGSSSGFCWPARCAPHKKCCFWMSLFRDLTPR